MLLKTNVTLSGVEGWICRRGLLPKRRDAQPDKTSLSQINNEPDKF